MEYSVVLGACELNSGVISLTSPQQRCGVGIISSTVQDNKTPKLSKDTESVDVKSGFDLKSDFTTELFPIWLHSLSFCESTCSDLGLEIMAGTSMVVGSCCYWARHFMSHSSWGCFGQSVVLGDHPSAQAWLLSVKFPFMFCSYHFSKFYSCFKLPLKSFPVIPASCDHTFRFLSLLGTWRVLLLIQSLVHTHFLYCMYFLFSQCGVFLARSLSMGNLIHSFIHSVVLY